MRLRTVVLCAVVFGWTAPAAAEPYIAVRSGFKCDTCHVNMTGGGMRTSYVAAHARQILHYPDWFDDLTKPLAAFDGEINQYLAVGGDLRVDVDAVFQDQPGEDGRVSNNKVFRGRLESLDVEVGEAVGYLNVRLVPDLLEFYVDLRFAPTVDAREAWAMLYLPHDLYLKAGRMFLPYGLQIRDDQSFIRGGRNGSASTGFNFNLEKPAAELGWLPGPWSFVVALSEGAGERDVQVTGTAFGMFTELPVVHSILIGGSGTRNGGSAETYEFGIFAGFNLWRFTYLGEVDFVETRLPPSGDPTGPKSYRGGFIHYSEGNCRLFDWLNLKITFEYADYDGDLNSPGSAENRFGIGLEPFLARFLQTSLFYRIGNGVESIPSHNQNVLTAEVHVFF